MNIGKILALFEVLRKGSSLSDPKLWKNTSAAVVAVTGVLTAIVHALEAFGYVVVISSTQMDALAAGVVTLVSLYFTFATSDKVGIFPAKPGSDDGVQSGSETARTAPGGMHGNP